MWKQLFDVAYFQTYNIIIHIRLREFLYMHNYFLNIAQPENNLTFLFVNQKPNLFEQPSIFCRVMSINQDKFTHIKLYKLE